MQLLANAPRTSAAVVLLVALFSSACTTEAPTGADVGDPDPTAESPSQDGEGAPADDELINPVTLDDPPAPRFSQSDRRLWRQNCASGQEVAARGVREATRSVVITHQVDLTVAPTSKRAVEPLMAPVVRTAVNEFTHTTTIIGGSGASWPFEQVARKFDSPVEAPAFGSHTSQEPIEQSGFSVEPQAQERVITFIDGTQVLRGTWFEVTCDEEDLPHLAFGAVSLNAIPVSGAVECDAPTSRGSRLIHEATCTVD